MNEKVDIEINRRRMTVEMEGFTELEILTLAKNVSDKLEEVAGVHKNVADSSKLAILTALQFAAELSRVSDAHADMRRVAERKIEELTLTLQAALKDG